MKRSSNQGVEHGPYTNSVYGRNYCFGVFSLENVVTHLVLTDLCLYAFVYCGQVRRLLEITSEAHPHFSACHFTF